MGIAAVNVQQDEADTVSNLRATFDDVNSPDNELRFSVAGNSNPALFTAAAVSNSNGTLTLDYAPGQSGQAT